MLLTTAQFGAAMRPPVSARRVSALVAAGRIAAQRINPRLLLIDRLVLYQRAARRFGYVSPGRKAGRDFNSGSTIPAHRQETTISRTSLALLC
jgi:hypothetical protein